MLDFFPRRQTTKVSPEDQTHAREVTGLEVSDSNHSIRETGLSNALLRVSFDRWTTSTYGRQLMDDVNLWTSTYGRQLWTSTYGRRQLMDDVNLWTSTYGCIYITVLH